MKNRKEYLKKYYQEHKNQIIQHVLEDYKNNKTKHLTYQRTYYILNRDTILAKLKKYSFEKRGHAELIYKAIKKYAKQWKVPYDGWQDFIEWAMNDPMYDQLFLVWEASGWLKDLCPVVMRSVKKNGFTIENIKWDIKQKYSWWNADSDLLTYLRKAENEQQKIVNKGTEDQRDDIRNQLKKGRVRK